MLAKRWFVSMLCVLALATSAKAGVIISEIDYDNAGTDNAEWIELHNPDGSSFDLVGIDLVLYNANATTCAEYDRYDLSPYSIPANGYIIVGNFTSACTVLAFSGASNRIQNGTPDIVYLEDRINGGIVDLVEYEAAALTCSFTTGTATTAADNNDDATGSIQLCPGGWVYDATYTPCAANNCQVISVEEGTWGGVKSLFQ